MDHKDLDQYDGQIVNIEHIRLRETRIIIHQRRYFTVRDSNNHDQYIILRPINVRNIKSVDTTLDSEPSKIEQTALEYVSSIKRRRELGSKVIIERAYI